MNVRTGGGAVALRRGLAATSRMLILLLLSHRRRERRADRILVLSGIVPAGARYGPQPAGASVPARVHGSSMV